MSGNLIIWSVSYPTLTKLQNLTADNKITDLQLSKCTQIFIWNNGQKIFMGIAKGYLYVYQRNLDGVTWTKSSISTQIQKWSTAIISIFVNKAGTTMYIALQSTSSNLVVLTWNGSSWLIQKIITVAAISSAQISIPYNVYLTKNQSELWVHGYQQRLYINSNAYSFHATCFFKIASNSFQMLYSLSDSTFVVNNIEYAYNYQTSMKVSSNQKFISWGTNGVNIIAVFDQSKQRYTFIKKQPNISGKIQYFIDQNNILNELVSKNYTSIQFNRYQMNYNGSSPSSTKFTIQSSITASVNSFADACFSKSSNYVFFVKKYNPVIIHSLGTFCSSQSSCLVCADSSKCDRCFPGYKLSSDFKCDSCQNGYYTVLNSSPLSCPSCPQRCITCQSSTNCTSCSKQYVLSNWNCLSCSSGYYMKNTYCLACVNGCESCTSSTVCSKCQAGYYVTTLSTDKVCVKCPNGCIQCSSPSNCISCISLSGYIISNQLCVQCSPNCITCFNSTQCQTCKPNYKKINGQCVCSQGYYLEGPSCIACLVNCKSCVNGILCTACKDFFTTLASNCQDCVENYYFGQTQTCQFCDPKSHLLVSLRTPNALRKSCVLTKVIKQIPNCAQFQLINSIYQCKTCISGSTPKTNVLRRQHLKTECVLNNDIQKAKSKCTQFRASQSYHFCADCAYPYSLRHTPNMENKILFQCVQILSLEYERNCRTQNGQNKPCSQCDTNQKIVAKINMNTNKHQGSSFIKLITPKCTIQDSSQYCRNFVCSTESSNI